MEKREAGRGNRPGVQSDVLKDASIRTQQRDPGNKIVATAGEDATLRRLFLLRRSEE